MEPNGHWGFYVSSPSGVNGESRMESSTQVEAARRISTADAARHLGLKLRRSANDSHISRCPLPGHGRQTGASPPLRIYAEPDGGWKCYGCNGAGGDGISLVQAALGLDFLAAVAELVPNGNGYHPPTRPAVVPGTAYRGSSEDAAEPWEASSLPPPDLRHPELGAVLPGLQWLWKDPAGRLFAVNCRFDTPDGKDYRRWRNGAWSLGGISLRECPLYGSEFLPGFDRTKPLWIVEGERCTKTLRLTGAQVLGTAGSGCQHSRAVLSCLEGWQAPVVLWADYDLPTAKAPEGVGLRHMRDIASRLPAGLDVRVWCPVLHKHGTSGAGDAIQWLDLRTHLEPEETLNELNSSIPAREIEPWDEEPETPPAALEAPAGRVPEAVVTVSGVDFISCLEDLPEALIGTPEQALLPMGGDLMLFGAGGSSKTSLTNDAIAHLCSGTRWLDLVVSRPLRVLMVENEGPRAYARLKLRKKNEGWNGSPWLHNLVVWTNPWGGMTFASKEHREALAQIIADERIDVLVVGPLATLGIEGGGTSDEIEKWRSLVAEVRNLCPRPFALWIIHHENKAGDESGAWSRPTDTLIQVSVKENGRTFLYFKKCRWSSELHQTRETLLWEGGDGFRLETPRATRDYAAEVLAVLSDQWMTKSAVKKESKARDEHVTPALASLVTMGKVETRNGPKNSLLYRLKVCSSLFPGTPGNTRNNDTSPGRIGPAVPGLPVVPVGESRGHAGTAAPGRLCCSATAGTAEETDAD